MKRLSTLLLALCLLLLAACQGAVPPAGSAAPSDESAPPASPTLPWTPPPAEDAPAYEDYFSQVIPYGYLDTEFEGEWKVSSGQNLDGDRLVYQAPSLYYSRGDHQWLIAEIPELELICCNKRWIYATAGGTELFRMDYFGQRETLYTDESGLLSVGPLGDEKVLYFWAGTPEGGAAVYRLYLPENRVDTLYRITPEELDASYCATPQSALGQELLGGSGPRSLLGPPAPISNVEFTWTTKNLDFVTIYDTLAADAQSYPQYFGPELEWYETIGRIEMDYQVKLFTDHYYHGLTGVYLTRQSSGYSYASNPWWKDAQG